MAAGSTYTPIATTTLGSAAASYTFSSIPSTYTDLILVVNGSTSSTNIDYGLRFNSDSGSNYSRTYVLGTGSAAASGRDANLSHMIMANFTSSQSTVIFQIMNYSNSTTYKTALSRSNSGTYVIGYVGMWRNTNAITSVEFLTTSANTLAVGSVLTLYGIASA
jgi:hypothetical protein